MSAAVLHFVPHSELDAATNVEAFVSLCRTSKVLDSNLQFGKNTWNVGHFKGRNGLHRVTFSTLETLGRGQGNDAFPTPFLDFAKAMIVYLQDMRPVKSQGPRIGALRCLEAALRQMNKASRPTAVTPEVLDVAVELGKDQVSPSVAYRWAGQLELISRTMHLNGFIKLRQAWMHGQKKPAETGTRISREALEERQKKLPSGACLRALAGIFNQATEAPDVLVSSFTALMLCAPERINEVLRLRRNCLVPGEGEFEGKLGLRWPGSKAFPNTTKWLPTEMAPVAREALANLLQATAEAHALAHWYTQNPGVVFLHEDAKHLRTQPYLAASDIALLLWGDERKKVSAEAWAGTTHKLSRCKGPEGVALYRFEDVERAVLGLLPRTFPFMPGDANLRCEDALAVMAVDAMHSRKRAFKCMFTSIDHQAISNRYGTTDKMESIFERFGYTEDDGSKIGLRSHALRHYLNTLAQTGLSSAEIALFSGRKDQRQNRFYDHMTSDEVQAPISVALKNGFTSELVPLKGRRSLIERPEFRGLGIPAAHTTEFGWCQHDFASEPCQMYRDCINCEEHECIKGEATKERNLRLLEEETRSLLERAKSALSESEYGADIWVKHQTKTLERVQKMLALLADPSIQSGARIRLDLTNAPLITTDRARIAFADPPVPSALLETPLARLARRAPLGKPYVTAVALVELT